MIIPKWNWNEESKQCPKTSRKVLSLVQSTKNKSPRLVKGGRQKEVSLICSKNRRNRSNLEQVWAFLKTRSADRNKSEENGERKRVRGRHGRGVKGKPPEGHPPKRWFWTPPSSGTFFHSPRGSLLRFACTLSTVHSWADPRSPFWRGPEIFREGALSGTFPPPIRFAPPAPYHDPKVERG